MNPTKLFLLGNAKNQEALKLIDKFLWNISDSKERWINTSVNHEAFNSFLDAVISNLEKMKKTFILILTFSFFMKYRCRTCKTTCDDIMEHIKKVHGFSESNIKDTLKTKPSYYENCFEKIK